MLNKFDSIFSDENLEKVEWSRPILKEFEIFAQLTGTKGELIPMLTSF